MDYLILKGLGLKSVKNWSTNITLKMVHNCYSKLAHKRYSKIGLQTLLKIGP